MSIENKIKKVKSSFLKSIEGRFDSFIKQTNSPIEKLYLLRIINFIVSSHPNLEELDDYYFDYWAIVVRGPSIEVRPGRFTSRLSLEAQMEFGPWRSFDEEDRVPLWYTLRVQPQEMVFIPKSNKKYLLDIGLTMILHKDNGEQKKVTKMAIECDGHEYHSTPEQKEKDNKRTRELKTVGWDVFRFSGKEIYNFEDPHFESEFAAIIDLLKGSYP